MKLLKKILTAMLFIYHGVFLSDAKAWQIVPYLLTRIGGKTMRMI
jgi:hypothetical protein